MSPQRRGYALDASVLIEILAGSDIIRELVDAIIAGDVEPYAVRLGLTEALYITCRLWGRDRALQRMGVLMESETITIIEDHEVWEHAADCKCKIPISLGDCYTLAAAKKYGLTPLFLKPERELKRNKGRIEEWLGREPEYITNESQKGKS